MTTGIGGKRLVVGLYLAIVCFTGVAGYLTGSVVDEITPPRFLFLIEFPATRLGLAAYGALTIALVLGVLLWLVTVASARIDDDAPGTDDDGEQAGDDDDVERAGDGGEPGADGGAPAGDDGAADPRD